MCSARLELTERPPLKRVQGYKMTSIEMYGLLTDFNPFNRPYIERDYA